MLNASDPLVKIGITSVVCTVPAIATTAYRLWIRRGRYWADDAWALASAISQFLMFSGSFIHITNSSPQKSMIAAYYLMAAPFYTVVWFARLSILFSIIRIDPSDMRRRRLLLVAVLFFLITVILVAQLWWVCEPTGSIWKHENSPQCPLTRQVVVLQLVTDILADTILIICPLRLLRNLSDRKLRRRLTVIFSTCLITTAVSLIHAAFIFVHAGHKEVIAAIVEDCVSLIVCNVPVVVTSLLHIQQDVHRSRAQGPKRSGIRFASWHAKSTVDESVVVTSFTTTAPSDWMNNFRWERELTEDSDNTAIDTVSSNDHVKNTSVEIQLSDK